MKDKRDYSNVTVTHIMADGSVRDSLIGYKISAEDLPLTARLIIRDMMLAGMDREKNKIVSG